VYCEQFVGEAKNMLYRLKNRMNIAVPKLKTLQDKRSPIPGTTIIVKSVYGRDEIYIDAPLVEEIAEVVARPIAATYDFKENKIFFRGVTERFYIDLNGVVDNCHDGSDYLYAQSLEGVTDRRVLIGITVGISVSDLKAFSLLEENGIYGVFIIGWELNTDIVPSWWPQVPIFKESYVAYKFKITSRAGGIYTWTYTDQHLSSYNDLNCQSLFMYDRFSITDTYEKYNFQYVAENIPEMDVPGFINVRGFKAYSKVGLNLSSLTNLKFAVGGTFIDSNYDDNFPSTLFWYDSGEENPTWHSILTNCAVNKSHGSDIFNCVFAISGGVSKNEITDVLVAWSNGHWVTWPVSGVGYWDWYVTDKDGAETYLYKQNASNPPYNIGATFKAWSPIDRKGGGIKTNVFDRLSMIVGVIDWRNSGTGYYRINGTWYDENSVPVQYMDNKLYPFGAIRGKELLYSAKSLPLSDCPVINEKAIPWTTNYCSGYHHVEGYRGRFSGDSHDSTTIRPITYFYGEFNGKDDIIGFSRIDRIFCSYIYYSFIDGEWVPRSYDLIDYFNFISDFAVY